MFKIKGGYKLEIQTSETMSLFSSIKKLIGKRKNRENVLSIKLVAVVLVQCNLIDHKSQHKSEFFYNFTPNKSYAY